MKALFCFFPVPVNWNNGIAVLSSLCKQRGIETELYRLNLLQEFIDYLRGKQYDLVSFSFVIKKDFDLSFKFVEAALLMGYKVAMGGTYLRRNVPTAFDG